MFYAAHFKSTKAHMSCVKSWGFLAPSLVSKREQICYDQPLIGVVLMVKKLTPEIIDGIIEAFERVGGVEYLVEIAAKDPPTFCMLLAKIIPAEVKASVQVSNSVDIGAAMAVANERLNLIENQ